MEFNITRSIVSTDFNSVEDAMRKDIENLLEKYKIELKTLSKMIEVDYLWLKDYMDRKINLYDFYISGVNAIDDNGEKLYNSNIPNRSELSNKIFMLSEGVLSVSEDDRVKGVIDVLVSEFEVSYETLAIYSRLELEELHSFMKDTKSISYEKRYKLAVASLFLHYLFKK